MPLPQQGQLVNDPPEPAKPKKKKEPKESKPSTDLPVDIGRLDLRIGKVEDVQRHPDADALYVLKINCGEAQPRTVCSGLVKYIPIEELRDRSVLVLCNLKPVKVPIHKPKPLFPSENFAVLDARHYLGSHGHVRQ